MVKPKSTEALRAAFRDLCSQRDDQGVGLTLQDVCDKAGVSRATAYRGAPSFKTEFDQKLAALRGDEEPAAPSSDESRGRYRRIIRKLANQLQAVALQLENERRTRTLRPEAASAAVVPFPGKVKQA